MHPFRPHYDRGIHSTVSCVFTFLSLSLFTSASASAASFDCNRADLATDERVICENRVLNDADVRMVTTFDLLSGLLAMGARGSMQDRQVEWLSKRQACGAEIACLTSAYQERQKELRDIYNEMPRHF